MARFTMSLEDVVKYFGDGDTETGLNNLFDFPYPWDLSEEEKTELVNDFYNYYRFSEIGQETPGRFKHFLSVQWALRMQKYAPAMAALKNTKIEPLENYNGNIRTTSDNVLNPQTPQPDGKDYIDSKIITETEQSGYNGRTASEMLDDYIDRSRELKREFLDSLSGLFMFIY